MYQSNITSSIVSKIGLNLHNEPINPICILKNKILEILKEKTEFNDFKVFTELAPSVSVQNNFDRLLIPIEHVSRSSKDTFYIDEQTVLRTHTSAHQWDLLSEGDSSFIVVGDVYRRDEIDRFHYPVFHQMEGVLLFNNIPQNDLISKLKTVLQTLLVNLFDSEIRFIESYFPFTHPSFEVEVLLKNKWIEVLGCGIIQNDILKSAGISSSTSGFAFGLGLERLAMILFDIPDIRYFWSKDPRFLNQFISKDIVKFKEFSNYPVCYKDISFWIGTTYNDSDFYEIVRDVGGDLIEEVVLIDTYTNSKTNKISKCFRISYRHLEMTLVNSEIDLIQSKIRERLSTLDLELR